MKQIDENNFDLDMLESLGIYVLRDIARKSNVKLPTTLKKAELIRQIRAVKKGEQEPYFPTTKRGRPPKTIESVDKLASIYFQNNDKAEELSDDNFEYVRVCESDLRQIDYERTINDDVLMKGYFDEVRGGGVIVDVFSKVCLVLLQAKEVKQFNLKKGDYVECLARYQEKNKSYRLVNVLKVNDNQPCFERFDFLNAPSVDKVNKINLVAGGNYNSIENNVVDCMFGDRITITGSQRNQIDYSVINLLNNNKDNAKIVSLLVDSTKEQVEDFKKIPKNVVFPSFCGEFYSFHLKTMFLACEYVIRLCESGQQNVIFAIPNLNATISALCNEKEAYYEVVRKLKQVFMLAKNCFKTSLTIVLGVLKDSDIAKSFEGCENVRLVLHENAVTDLIRFKFDILLSQRSDFALPISEVRKCVCDYLIKNQNSYESVKFVDSLMFDSVSTTEFLNNLK